MNMQSRTGERCYLQECAAHVDVDVCVSTLSVLCAFAREQCKTLDCFAVIILCSCPLGCTIKLIIYISRGSYHLLCGRRRLVNYLKP